MRLFKDKDGREWTVALDIATVKRVRDLAGVNLLDTTDGSALARVARDLLLFMETMYAVCKPQCDKRDVSSDAFYVAIEGEPLTGAAAAFWSDLEDFFRRLGRAGHADAVAKLAEAIVATTAATVEYLKEIDVPTVVQRAFGDLRSSLPGKPA